MEMRQKKYTFGTGESLRKPMKGKSGSAAKRRMPMLPALLLLLLLLLLLFCFHTFLFPGKEDGPSDEAPAKTVSLVDPDQPVTRLQIRLENEPPYTLLRNEDGSLSVEGMEYFSLEEDTAASMLRHCQNIYAEESLPLPEDLAAYGLEQPWLDLTVNETRIRVGGEVPTMPSWYALRDDDPYIYAIPRSLVSALARGLNELHTCPRINTLTDVNIDYVYIQMNQGETLELSRAAADSSPLMTSFFLTLPYRYPAHSYRVSGDILPALPLLNPSAYAGHITEGSDARQYGLDQPYARIKASDNTGSKLQLCIGSQIGSSRYLSIDDTGDVYLIDDDLLSFLDYARSDYLAEQFPSLIPVDQVSSVALSCQEQSYLLDILPARDGSRQFQLNGKELETEQGRKLYEQIVSIQHDTSCSDLPENAKPVLSVSFRLLDGDEYTVEYLEVNEDYLAIRADGETHFMVKRNKLEALIALLQEL